MSRFSFYGPVYVLPDRQAIKKLLMTIGSLTGIMRKPLCFLIALDANVRLHFDDLNVLTCSQAFSYGLDSGIKNAQVLGLFVQAWASQMFADHIHGTQAVGCYYSLGVRMGNRKDMFHAGHSSPLDGIGHCIPVTNWVDAKLNAWANMRI